MPAVKDNVIKVQAAIGRACARSGRDPALVRVIAVAKNRTIEQIRQAVSGGITDIGENRVQEALSKYGGVPQTGFNRQRVRLHMIGHLQTNKVRDAVRIFDLIHSVDSLRLAQEIDARAARIDKVQDILLEVNISEEAAKSGVRYDEAFDMAVRLRALAHIRLLGLMSVAAVVNDPQEARPFFGKLRTLFNDINTRAPAASQQEPLRILSMGMSQDYEVAVEEGATMVRIGRAIFDG
jgi:hypothetical protein